MNKNIDRESVKWGFLAQRCSFVHVSYISHVILRSLYKE